MESDQLLKGDVVEVKAPAEILATLDATGALEELPFMPEMTVFCGRRFVVERRAERVCDTVAYSGARRAPRTVLLADLRCDGSAHGGCQADCLFFWKDAWLKPAPGPGGTPGSAPDPGVEQRLARAAATTAPGEAEPTYACQTTRLFDATSPLPTWSPAQYLADVRSGNEGALEALNPFR